MEEPVSFSANEKRLFGILHWPNNSGKARIIVIVVTGGPQTRIGGHRLYVQLARYLCQRGIPVLRFDYEGSGDSEGEYVGFRYAGDSIKSALSFLDQKMFPGFKKIIWSVCDGATSSLIWAGDNIDSIDGLILCNPYIISDEEELGQLALRRYYIKRIIKKEFWKKIITFKLNYYDSYLSFKYYLKKAKILKMFYPTDGEDNKKITPIFLKKLTKFKKPVNFILSGQDLLAQQFLELTNRNKELNCLGSQNKIKITLVAKADHTFTEPEAKKEMFQISETIIRGYFDPQ